MTASIKDWIDELAQFPLRAPPADCAEVAERESRRRDALRTFEMALPLKYRWARLGHPLLAKRAKGMAIPEAPPTASSVVFLGRPGAGKTSLAVALLRSLLERELAAAESADDFDGLVRGFRFVHAHRLGVARIPGSADPDEIRNATNARVLLLDDLGEDCDVPSNPVPGVIIERHAEERTTWITTSRTPTAIAERYGGGIARRVFEHAHRFAETPVRSMADSERI
ncbi:MAG: hypothetical protein ABI551_25165 [Polyangiaceae bacterium]